MADRCPCRQAPPAPRADRQGPLGKCAPATEDRTQTSRVARPEIPNPYGGRATNDPRPAPQAPPHTAENDWVFALESRRSPARVSVYLKFLMLNFVADAFVPRAAWG